MGLALVRVGIARRGRHVAASLLLCLSASAHAADTSELASRGKAILQEQCGRCHAVEAVGDSPLKAAPPMRDVYARYAPTELRAELLEGMVSRHRAMPQIAFSDQDADDILAYLYALAVGK
jgi:mono/diheme cytochrome c family protein